MRITKYLIFLLIIGLLIIGLYKPLIFKPFPSSSLIPELVGVFHIHSNLSDGRLSVREIAKSARKSGLDFVLLTDHGNPNLKNLEEEGFINGVSIISGSEVSLFEGSLIALGIKKPSYKISAIAEEALDDVRELGGVSVVAHPEGEKNFWRKWDLEGIDGIEILDLSDEILRKNIFSIAYSLFTYTLNSRFSILRLIKRPVSEIRIWDRELKRRKIYGFYGLNLHGKLWILPFSYEKPFNILRIHIPLKGKKPEKFEELKKLILKSLKEGNFYSAVDGAGTARGFRFFASKGENKVEMGREAEIGSTLNIELPFQSEIETTILRNGKEIFSTKEKKIRTEILESGVYRVEVKLRKSLALDPSVPWILSNPIFVKGRENIMKKVEISGERTLYFDLKKLNPENDEGSKSEIVFYNNQLKWNYSLGFSSTSRPHVWCALSLREKIFLKEYIGMGIEAKATPPSRVWVQLRDVKDGEERWWSYSIKIKENFSDKKFKFSDLVLTKGSGGEISLDNLTGLFLIIDKGSMWEGSKGGITLKNIYAIK
ncbi:MAG: PHP domain-containing protein [Candidatus Aminicenantia bacterium]